MKNIRLLHRMIFVFLSFTVLLLTGCGSGSDSAPIANSATFTVNQVTGKTFAFDSSTGSKGMLTFKADKTWSTTIGTLALGGTWSVIDGELVCVTTTGGNFILTYTLLSTDSNVLTASVVQVNPANPANPTKYTSTLTDVSILPSYLIGKWSDIKKSNQATPPVLVKINPSSTGNYSTLIFNADGTGSIVQYTETLNVTTGEYEIQSNVPESTTSLNWTLANNQMQLDISGKPSSWWVLTNNGDGTITEVGADGDSYMIQKN
jgi:hypothetical protein